jgi:hypothetical protein
VLTHEYFPIPAICYGVVWDQTGTNTLELVYQEWNGSSWVTNLQKRAGLIFTGDNALIATGAASTDGHWFEGMSIVDDGVKPQMTFCLGSAVSNLDYIGIATVADDGSDFEAYTQALCDKGNAAFTSSGGWNFQCGESVWTETYGLLVQNTHDDIAAPCIFGLGETGDGTGWHIISNPNAIGWPSEGTFYSEMRVRWRNNTLYLLADNWDGVLGIWAITPVVGGVVSMNWRSSDRRGTANRVLIGG